jgi:hypothetical protein
MSNLLGHTPPKVETPLETKKAYIKEFTPAIEKEMVKIGFSTYVERDDLARKWRVETIEGKPYIVAVDENIVVHSDQYDVRDAAQGTMLYKGDMVVGNISLPSSTDAKAVTAELKSRMSSYKHLPVSLFVDVMTKEAQALSTRFLKMQSNMGGNIRTAARSPKKKTDSSKQDTESEPVPSRFDDTVELTPEQTRQKQLREQLASHVTEQLLSSSSLTDLDDYVASSNVPLSEILDKMNNVAPEKLLENPDVKGTALEPIMKRIVNTVKSVREKYPKEKLQQMGKEIKSILTNTSVQTSDQQTSILFDYMRYTITTTQMLKAAVFGYIQTATNLIPRYIDSLMTAFKEYDADAVSIEDPNLLKAITSFSAIVKLIAGKSAFGGDPAHYTMEDLSRVTTTVKEAFATITENLSQGQDTLKNLSSLPKSFLLKMSLAQQGEGIAKQLGVIITELNILSPAQWDILSLISVKTTAFQTSISAAFSRAGLPATYTTQVAPSSTMGVNSMSGKAEFDTTKISQLDFSGILNNTFLKELFMSLGLQDGFRVLSDLTTNKISARQDVLTIPRLITTSKTATDPNQLKVVAETVNESITHILNDKLILLTPAEYTSSVSDLLDIKEQTVQGLTHAQATDIIPRVTQEFDKLIGSFKTVAENIKKLTTTIVTPDNQKKLIMGIRSAISSGSITADEGQAFAWVLGSLFKQLQSGTPAVLLQPAGKEYSQKMTEPMQKKRKMSSIKFAEESDNTASLLEISQKYKEVLHQLNTIIEYAQHQTSNEQSPSRDFALAAKLQSVIKTAAKKEDVATPKNRPDLKEVVAATEKLSKMFNSVETLIGVALLQTQDPILREFTSGEFSSIFGEGFSSNTTPMEVQDKVRALEYAVARKVRDLSQKKDVISSMKTDLIGGVDHQLDIAISRGPVQVKTDSLGSDQMTPQIKLFTTILGTTPQDIAAFFDVSRNTIKDVMGSVKGIGQSSKVLKDAFPKLKATTTERYPSQKGVLVEHMAPDVGSATAALLFTNPTIFARWSDQAKNMANSLKGAPDKAKALEAFADQILPEAFESASGKSPVVLGMVYSTALKSFMGSLSPEEKTSVWNAVTPDTQKFIRQYLSKPGLEDVSNAYQNIIQQAGSKEKAQKYLQSLSERGFEDVLTNAKKRVADKAGYKFHETPEWAHLDGLQKLKFDIDEREAAISKMLPQVAALDTQIDSLVEQTKNNTLPREQVKQLGKQLDALQTQRESLLQSGPASRFQQELVKLKDEYRHMISLKPQEQEQQRRETMPISITRDPDDKPVIAPMEGKKLKVHRTKKRTGAQSFLDILKLSSEGATPERALSILQNINEYLDRLLSAVDTMTQAMEQTFPQVASNDAPLAIAAKNKAKIKQGGI